MSFIEGYKTKYVSNSIRLYSNKSDIWQEITNVMVSRFNFPFLFKLLGIPKPLSAEVVKKGVGGYRIASFSNDAQFQQEIIKWTRNKEYRFNFNPTNNFKVGYFMNLSDGPFQIKTGGYEIVENKTSVDLVLSSNYKLNGLMGRVMHIPFRIVIFAFQRYLLKGIRQNLNQQLNTTQV